MGIISKNETVTAGNASGFNDGSAVVYFSSGEAVVKFGLKPLARIVCSAIIGVETRIMGIGSVTAAQKVLEKQG